VSFVADSQKERMAENKRSFEGLKVNLERQGYNYKTLPMVMQYNKQDLSNSLSLKDIRLELNKDTFPDFVAQAHVGVGVFEPLKEISKKIITSLKSGKMNA